MGETFEDMTDGELFYFWEAARAAARTAAWDAAMAATREAQNKKLETMLRALPNGKAKR